MSDKKESAVIDIHNRVTGDELERLLKMQLKALFATPELAKTLPPLVVWGAPGLGKSSILQQVASEMKIGMGNILTRWYGFPSAVPVSRRARGGRAVVPHLHYGRLRPRAGACAELSRPLASDDRWRKARHMGLVDQVQIGGG